MSKKGKRKKGNTAGSLERRSRPSLPGVSGTSGTTAPPSRASAPTAPPVATTAATPTLASTPTLSMGGRSLNHAAPGAHTDVLVGKAAETSAAAELAPLPPPPAVATTSEIPPRSDKQEESGPRIVAFAPTKDDAKPEAGKKAEKKAETAKSEKSDKTEKAASRKSERPPAKSERPPAKASQPPPAKSSPPPAAKAERAERKEGKEGESMPHAVELEHESFFEAGEKADKEHRAVARGVLPVDHEHEVDLTVKHKMSPAVRERRARFTKYVKWAVGASAIVCLAALVRVTVARGQNGGESFAGGSQAAEISAPMPIQTVTPAPDPTLNQASPPAPAPPAPAPAVDPTAAAVPAATATPDPASTAAAPAAAPAAASGGGAAPATEPDPAAAKVEKLAAKKALERGDMKGAIEAGERSVALDPTDGDAWLLLGAAYQEKGKAVDARRAFTACIKQGKRGAVGECAAMLR